LKVKVAYLRKAHRKLPTIAHLSDEASAIADEIQRLKEVRHDCIHGIHGVPLDSTLVEFLRVRYEGSQLRLQRTTLDQGAISTAVADAVHLHRKALGLFGSLAVALDNEQAKDIHHQLTVSLATLSIPGGD